MQTNQRKAGIFLTYVGQAVQLLSGLIYTPIMLRLLGQSEYGLYTLVNSVVSYLGLLSFGFGSAYMRFYSKFKAQKNETEIARLNGMFMTIFLIIAGICLICGGIMIGNIEVIFGEGLTSAEYDKARVLMILMVFNLAMTFPLSVYDSNVTAHEQFIFQKVIVLLQNLLNPFICLPLLILGYGSVALVSVATLLTIAKTIVNIMFCTRKLHIHFLFKGFRWSLLKEMWIFTFFIFINNIIDQVNWSVDKFLLGRFAGTVAVAVYGVSAQLNSMYLNFSTAVSNVFVPEVNRIVAESDDNDALTELFIKVGRVQFMILGLIISGFAIFGKAFIFFWAGKGYDDSYEIAMLLMVPVTIPLIQNLGIEIQRAKNKHQVRSVVYLFMAIVNVCISIPLIQVFGGIGAAMGTAISLFLSNGLFMNWFYHKHIDLNIIVFWKSIFGLIPAFVLPFICGVGFYNFFDLYHPVFMVCCIFSYIVVYCLSMWLWGMNDIEKNIILSLVKKII